MGGFFGTIKKENCVADLFYGVDYNSHMGTKRGGMVTLNNGNFTRSIHNIENSYFRTKFEADLPSFSGNSGIGVISDTDAQPIIINSHLGKFAVLICRNLKRNFWQKEITFANTVTALPINRNWCPCLLSKAKLLSKG